MVAVVVEEDRAAVDVEEGVVVVTFATGEVVELAVAWAAAAAAVVGAVGAVGVEEVAARAISSGQGSGGAVGAEAAAGVGEAEGAEEVETKPSNKKMYPVVYHSSSSCCTTRASLWPSCSDTPPEFPPSSSCRIRPSSSSCTASPVVSVSLGAAAFAVFCFR